MGLVQVATETVSSPVSSVTLTGIDSDDVYMVAYNNLTSDTDDRGVVLRFTYGGVTQIIASSIDTANKKLRADTTFENRSQTNVDYVRLDQFLGTGTSETAQGIIYLYNMNSTTEYAFCSFENVTYNYVPFLAGGQGGAVFKQTGTARDGITISQSSNFTAGVFTLYRVV